MDSCAKPRRRRDFLKNGIFGGLFFISLPFLRTGNPNSSRNVMKPRGRRKSDVHVEKIIRIAHRYGGEFGASEGGF